MYAMAVRYDCMLWLYVMAVCYGEGEREREREREGGRGSCATQPLLISAICDTEHRSVERAREAKRRQETESSHYLFWCEIFSHKSVDLTTQSQVLRDSVQCSCIRSTDLLENISHQNK